MITAIAFVIAGLGLAMLFLLYVRIRAANSQLALKSHRSSDAGFADLLNYSAMVDDGVVVGKNGSFMASWMYQGEDNASSTDAQRETVSFAQRCSISTWRIATACSHSVLIFSLIPNGKGRNCSILTLLLWSALAPGDALACPATISRALSPSA